MGRDDNDGDNNNSQAEKSHDPDNSFVKKVTSRVTGFIPSSFSKWFTAGSERTPANVRQRDEDEDDPFTDQAPPSKRAKMPLNVEYPPNSFIIDPPIINCKQKSAALSISEPVAGPSGVRPQKIFSLSDVQSAYPVIHHEHMNGDNKSDSGESTSGYSSIPRVAARKEQIKEKEQFMTSLQNATLPNLTSRSLFNSTMGVHNRSLFSERSVSPQVNSSLSSRRPSFTTTSSFGSPGFVDRTLTTKRIINSPFYSGHTTYGGTSAYGKRLKLSPKDAAGSSKRSVVQIKPINESQSTENVTLSRTARRILDTLEQFSSPILDAKKIPNVSRRQESTSAKPYSRERKTAVAATIELMVPTVPELLKMKLKEKLQDSTVAVRQIATTSKSALNVEGYRLRTQQDDDGTKQTTKMKKKLTLGRNKKGDDVFETVPIVKLPDVTLPISTLPKFDFSLTPPAPAYSMTVVNAKAKSSAVEKEPTLAKAFIDAKKSERVAQSPKDSSSYKFSSPIIVSSNESTDALVKTNEFMFSEPILMTDRVPVVTTTTTTAAAAMTSLLFNFKSSDATSPTMNLQRTVKNNGQNTQTIRNDIKPAARLLTTGSVMDVLGKKNNTNVSGANLMDKFKPSAGTWECSCCMIRNLPHDKTCAACQTPKEPPRPLVAKNDFGKEFKMTNDKWECSVCMIRNDNVDAKCVACTTPKQTLKNVGSAGTPTPIVSNTFGDKFKVPSGTWECDTCMIRNRQDATKCLACETPKPGVSQAPPPQPAKPTRTSSASGFGNMFVKTPNEWECACCMVRNNADKARCACCDAPKPGSVGMNECKYGIPTGAPPKYNFGVNSANATSTGGFTFGIPPGAEKVTPKPCDIFALAATTPMSYSFGVKSTITTTAATSAINNETKNVSSTSVGFTFGIPTNKPVETKTTTGKDVTDTVKPIVQNEAQNKKVDITSTNTTKSDATAGVRPEFSLSAAAATTKSDATSSNNLFTFGSKTPAATGSAVSEPTKSICVAASTVSSTTTSTAPNAFTFGSASKTTNEVKSTSSQPIAFNFNSNTTTPSTSAFGVSKTNVFGTSTSEIEAKNANATVSSSLTAMTSIPSFGTTFNTNNSTFLRFRGNDKPDISGGMMRYKKNDGSVKASPMVSFKPLGAELDQPKFAPQLTTFGGHTTEQKTTMFGTQGTAASGVNFNFKSNAAIPSFLSTTPNVSPFNAPSQTPANGGFNFNAPQASAAAPKAFNFGGNGQPPVNNQVFNFGSGSQTSHSPSGGFSFGANAAIPSLPMFNMGSKPDINFTQGVAPSFTAQPQDGGAPQRRIKKALRRTPR